MSGLFTEAEDWGYWREGRCNPIARIRIGQKWNVRPERILTPEETVRVLANLLIVETAFSTGAWISEMLGLTWRNVDLLDGVIHIVQRNWRGNISQPKSQSSKRFLTLGDLVTRYRERAESEQSKPDQFVFLRTDGSNLPLWDSDVRKALKLASVAESCDFPGFGPHSLRTAYIAYRQQVSATSIPGTAQYE